MAHCRRKWNEKRVMRLPLKSSIGSPLRFDFEWFQQRRSESNFVQSSRPKNLQQLISQRPHRRFEWKAYLQIGTLAGTSS